MSDDRRTTGGGKRSLIGPLVIVAVLAMILVAGAAYEIGRHAAPAPAPPPAPPPAALVETPAPKPPPKPVDRAELIAAADAAAARYASGDTAAPGAPGDPVVGRAFVLHIPFGCDGPQKGLGAEQLRYEIDADKKTLRLLGRPVTWTDLPMVKALPNAASVEAVEGFWLTRPWMTAETCPAARDSALPATPAPPSPPTLGLAAFFETGGSRVFRHADQPYEVVKKLDKAALATAAHPYALVLEGTLSGYADGRAAHCFSETADHRPVCLFAVTLARVAFEDPVSKAILGEWRP